MVMSVYNDRLSGSTISPCECIVGDPIDIESVTSSETVWYVSSVSVNSHFWGTKSI